MYKADFYNFLRVLFFIILFYNIFKLIVKYLTPVLVKRLVSKMQEKANAYNNDYTTDNREGQTIIDKKPITTKSNDNVGEYIDFEEIE